MLCCHLSRLLSSSHICEVIYHLIIYEAVDRARAGPIHGWIEMLGSNRRLLNEASRLWESRRGVDSLLLSISFSKTQDLWIPSHGPTYELDSSSLTLNFWILDTGCPISIYPRRSFNRFLNTLPLSFPISYVYTQFLDN